MLPPAAESILTRCPTQHAMLIVWGYFAQSLGLLEHLASVPVPQKTFAHPPYIKLLELFMGLLTGMEYLSDLSLGPSPLDADPAVAAAWGLPALADASGVSRTLAAADPHTLTVLQGVLDQISAPFWQRAIADLQSHNQAFYLDADLTGRAVSSSSQSYPGAAFGYMDGHIRLGYQVAEICLQTALFGRQWLAGQQHPGNTVSASCLFALLTAAEQRLGCHPRRRPELVAQRLTLLEQTLATTRNQLATQQAALAHLQTQMEELTGQIAAAEIQLHSWAVIPLSARQPGRYSVYNRLAQQVAGWQQRQARLLQRQGQYEARLLQLQAHQAQLEVQHGGLQQRWVALTADNAAQPRAPRCILRMDAGFASGENLTAAIELGYDLETKANNAGLVRALQARVTATTVWTRVGRNAEMIGWADYTLHHCPYPLTVGLERFHTPQGLRYAVLVRSQAAPGSPCLDLPAWFTAYNGRQTIEAGNKEEKTVFKLQRLFSRSAVGMEIQVAWTLFAANFVRWAEEWVNARLEQTSRRFALVSQSPKRLVRIGANSPGLVEREAERVLVRFGEQSSLPGVVVRVAGTPTQQLALPFFETDHFAAF
jgi:hypothetical protein